MGDYKYRINISGNNTINNKSADNDIFRDPVTCSNGSASVEKLKQIIQAEAWLLLTERLHSKDGKMYSHELNSNYTDGYKDNAYDVTIGDWVLKDDGTYTRNIKKVYKYCGYEVKRHTGRLFCNIYGRRGK